MQQEMTMNSLKDLPKTAASILPLLAKCPVVAFYGELGTGKTTLITEICRQLGVTDIVNSPTFALVNEYHTLHEEPIYHFDFYRIRTITEAYDLGYEEYFYSGHLCLIEWADRIEEILPPEFLKVSLQRFPDNSRLVTTEIFGIQN